MIQRVEELIGIAQRRKPTPIVASAAPEDADCLMSLRLALDSGIAVPLAIGRKKLMEEVAEKNDISLAGFNFAECAESNKAPSMAIDLIRQGRASMLMKGSTATKTVMKAILKSGIRSGRILSHIGLFDAPHLGKPILITDAGININPNLAQKIEIVKNAVEVMRRLGVHRPSVAMLAAVEHINLPAMPATLDAKLIERMNDAGLLGDIDVQGPLSLDTAISPDAFKHKKLTGPIGGRADILVVPEIETGNVLYKSLTCFAGLQPAGIVWGSSVPVIVVSRADSARSKFLSIALASVLSQDKPLE